MLPLPVNSCIGRIAKWRRRTEPSVDLVRGALVDIGGGGGLSYGEPYSSQLKGLYERLRDDKNHGA